MPADPRRAFRAALAALSRDTDRAAAAIADLRGFQDARTAFTAASEARELLDKLSSRMAALRADAASWIREDEALSLAKLAKVVNVSKRRADELVRLAKRQEDDDG